MRSVPCTAGLGMPFMGTRIHFKGSIVIPDRNDLLEVHRKKASNRTGLFVLVHVAELVRQ